MKWIIGLLLVLSLSGCGMVATIPNESIRTGQVTQQQVLSAHSPDAPLPLGISVWGGPIWRFSTEMVDETYHFNSEGRCMQRTKELNESGRWVLRGL